MNTDLPYMILLGIAGASVFKLVAVDRITQWFRHGLIKRLDKAGGFIPYHIQYVMGCALCLPLWAVVAMYYTKQFQYSRDITFILAGRMVAYSLLRYLQETGLRDWPKDIEWPPTK